MLVNMSLMEIFKQLVNSSGGDGKTGGALQFSSSTTPAEVYEETLLKSLEMSFLQLKRKDPKCIDIFLLLGLTHDGLTKATLAEIFS